MTKEELIKIGRPGLRVRVTPMIVGQKKYDAILVGINWENNTVKVTPVEEDWSEWIYTENAKPYLRDMTSILDFYKSNEVDTLPPHKNLKVESVDIERDILVNINYFDKEREDNVKDLITIPITIDLVDFLNTNFFNYQEVECIKLK